MRRHAVVTEIHGNGLRRPVCAGEIHMAVRRAFYDESPARQPGVWAGLPAQAPGYRAGKPAELPGR